MKRVIAVVVPCTLATAGFATPGAPVEPEQERILITIAGFPDPA